MRTSLRRDFDWFSFHGTVLLLAASASSCWARRP